MSSLDDLVVHAAPHPDQRVRQVGFDLDHRYVERCWVALLGPTATLLLRRIAERWRETEPAAVDLDDLARSLGLDGYAGGRNSRIWRTFDRLTQFRLAEWRGTRDLAVYSQVKPLSSRQLDRAPTSTRAAHDHLLDEHVRRLATGVGPSTGVEAIPTYLDRMQHAPTDMPPLGR
jgi:hypothetical protein